LSAQLFFGEQALSLTPFWEERGALFWKITEGGPKGVRTPAALKKGTEDTLLWWSSFEKNNTLFCGGEKIISSREKEPLSHEITLPRVLGIFLGKKTLPLRKKEERICSFLPSL